MDARTPFWYIAVLLIVGLAFTVYTPVLQMGGFGLALMAIGAAAIGAALVLIGMRLAKR